ncbi:fructose-1,6-bisphosphatase II [Malonomonas rubra DSM 5091]|uniref:Fructose-1,6-bisphosphatase n=1 Tax=Malonomonas rubra DSM 5091 TaxID=1122189 RepID=A0A1M6M4P5_MALRU|nr:class II fructose-bisphosphatase [Malonomonas rubra]SHJ78445.1 fructose-1,6-bisphosphatase II [Malonomonas rubra DSM 5091]
MDKNLALELARVTEAAALDSGRWVGKGDKISADAAATEAMRRTLGAMEINGLVVIGEGEMDEAPMLYIGEELGSGGEGECEVDIAVDPLEGTTICSKGINGAIATIAMAPRGGFLHAPDMYMDKLVTGPAGIGACDIQKTAGENVLALAKAKGCSPQDLMVVLLDRPRHDKQIAEIRKAGARCQLITDGDVAPAVASAIEGSGVDMMMGVGGAPEGVLTAAAIKCLGGFMQGRLVFMSEEERTRSRKMGITDFDKIYNTEEMAKGDVFFAATGVTNGELVRGVRYFAGGAKTHTVVMRSKSRTVRFIETIHYFDHKPGYKAGKKKK